MTTLSTSPCADVLAKLLAESDASEAAMAARRSSLPTNRDDYRTLYGALKDSYLAVSRETAGLLYMLVRSTGARSIVEFGTSFGISTLYMAAALRDNGGGRLITTEFEPTKVEQARANIAAAGLADLVEIRAGDALETLAHDLPATIDLVLLDGAKNLYPKVLALLEARLATGALIAADNADWSPEYLARVRETRGGYMSVPFASDVELSMRIREAG